MYWLKNTSKRCFFSLCIFTLLATGGNALAGSKTIDWNDDKINWRSYQDGLDYARQAAKPAIIIFYADWCPTCHKYSKIFKKKRIVTAASEFVMIRLNKDEHPKLSVEYGFDGEYIPRTLAVHPDGEVMHTIYPAKQYRYYIGITADDLLSLMQRASSLMKK